MWGNWFGTLFGPVGVFLLVLLLGLGTGFFGNPIIGIVIVLLLAPPLVMLAAKRKKGEATDTDGEVAGKSKHPETGARAARLGPSYTDWDRGLWGHKREA